MNPIGNEGHTTADNAETDDKQRPDILPARIAVSDRIRIGVVVAVERDRITGAAHRRVEAEERAERRIVVASVEVDQAVAIGLRSGIAGLSAGGGLYTTAFEWLTEGIVVGGVGHCSAGISNLFVQ